MASSTIVVMIAGQMSPRRASSVSSSTFYVNVRIKTPDSDRHGANRVPGDDAGRGEPEYDENEKQADERDNAR